MEGEQLEKYNLYAIDIDMCGKTDEPIKYGQCSGCQYYQGFQMKNYLRCIKCSYYAEQES